MWRFPGVTAKWMVYSLYIVENHISTSILGNLHVSFPMVCVPFSVIDIIVLAV